MSYPGTTALTPSETTKVTTVKVDWVDMVERMDPKRHDPELEYEFSNGRKFYRPERDSY